MAVSSHIEQPLLRALRAYKSSIEVSGVCAIAGNRFAGGVAVGLS
ncbi:hypothetical protein ACSFA8_23105 [Variovorax sp. RT4R15]